MFNKYYITPSSKNNYYLVINCFILINGQYFMLGWIMNPPNTKFINGSIHWFNGGSSCMVNYSVSYSCLQLIALLITTTKGVISFHYIISVISMQALHCIFTENIYILCMTWSPDLFIDLTIQNIIATA